MAEEPGSTATPAVSGDAGTPPVQSGETPVTTDDKSAAPSETPKTEEKAKPDPSHRKIAGLSYQNRELRRQLSGLRDLVEQAIGNRQERAPEQQPKMSDYGTVEEYLDARDRWSDQRREQTRKPERETQTPRVDADYEHTVAESRENLFAAGSEKYEDFADAVESAQGITTVMRDAIFALDDDIQVDLAYYLATNQKDALRIARLPPIRQVAEIGKLEAKITSTPAPKRTSAAPAPIEPVGGAETKQNKLMPNDSMDDHIRKRRAGVKFSG